MNRPSFLQHHCRYTPVTRAGRSLLGHLARWPVAFGCCVLLLGSLPMVSLAQERVLEARLVAEAPKVDGVLDDRAWTDAEPMIVAVYQPPFGERPGDTQVELRAVRTRDDVYLGIYWKDPTQSIYKEQWTYDGTGWSQDPDTDEDRLALIFPINDSVPWFSQAGCVLACHARVGAGSAPTRWYKATLDPAERLDVWHWKAARTNPLGYADDKYWNSDLPAPGRKNAGRHYDWRTPGPDPSSRNRTDDGRAPRLMQSPQVAPAIPGFLLVEHAVALDMSKLKPGDIVPGRVLAMPGGSRADVQARALYGDGAWHLEMRRALNTGQDDDAVFQPGQTIPFALAIFDNVSERRKQDHGRAMDRLRLRLAE